MKVEFFDEKVLKAITESTQEGCKTVAQFVSDNAHKRLEKMDDTGALANSIEVKESKFKDGGYMVKAYGNKAKGRYYASFVEFGYHSSLWGKYKRKGKKATDGPYVAAKPYMRPALRAAKRKMKKEIRAAIKRGIGE